MAVGGGILAVIGGLSDGTRNTTTTDALPEVQEATELEVGWILGSLSPVQPPPSVEALSEPASDVPPAEPAPVVDAPATPGPLGSVESVICSVAWECGIALRVARCESGADYYADFNESNHVGTFQISPIHAWRFSAHGWDFWNDGTVLERNVVIAYEIYKDRWWYAWSCF